MANVFISYGREDAPIAARLREMLQAEGHTVFYDQNTLVAGESFSAQIAEAIANAQAVLVLLSRNSKRGKWVEEELRMALEKGHRVIPVLLDQDATNNWVWPLISDRRAIRVESSAEIDEVVREITRSVAQSQEQEQQIAGAADKWRQELARAFQNNLKGEEIMSFSNTLLTHKYFPGLEIPFGEMLNTIFFNPTKGNEDFIIHGPNVIRFTEALLDWNFLESGLFKGDVKEVQHLYVDHYREIRQCLEAEKPSETKKVVELLKVAALFHDIGKYIRRENHPYIGANLIRNYDEKQQEILVNTLIYDEGELKTEAKYNRFSLISSIIQHHDKFGVLNTGEAALPIFSDILYFRSDEEHISGIKKNVTAVMLLNLADIAAVNTASAGKRACAAGLAATIHGIRCGQTPNKNEEEFLERLADICREPDSCLGLDRSKVENILNDWKILIDSIDHERVKGNRVKLKLHLMELERNPARTIQRILRLLQTSAEASNVPALLELMTPTAVESVLVGTLGSHYFLTFCDHMARAVKLDYGLNFFKAILCSCVRKAIDQNYSIRNHKEKQKDPLSYYKISKDEREKLEKLNYEDRAELNVKITALFVRVLEGMIGRYGEVLNDSPSNPRRFGFQMRDLTNNDDIRNTIIDFLCIQDHKDSIALTWLADEVTIWSVD